MLYLVSYFISFCCCCVILFLCCISVVTIFSFVVVANYVVLIAFIFVSQGTAEKQHLVAELFSLFKYH